MRLTLQTAADTHEFGLRLAALLRAGDLVILTGPLGAGKTALTQGIGAGLGVEGRITSPTFVIARSHRAGEAGVPLVHVDAYRLEHLDELDDLDLDADVEAAVTVVEWGAGLAERLAESHLEIAIERRSAGDEGGESREAVLHARGGDWAVRLASLGLPVGAAA
ncbi:tRNA (adenosine(37)-N6)-threonylcarbamoyltransferase complex ATPase subunit type 1 TsaE [Glycomyces sp. NRRL B-16210]|uniref:tRNA (adenosine(37)-N6)-threonylcarbamoyltransferase complex ATPase subunit type 1 TsaE n=1 Tax=Glycomyces sp. NRRL B-16210 TaxID=1463821 RepID=UPI0004BEDEFE|nr:tRNA (adenosine(37)-N6)-threonylcarbamoyltransferase complex ATPase subunit type 1 TsaE [Glycomyces sp. NRRL B-16210]